MERVISIGNKSYVIYTDLDNKLGEGMFGTVYKGKCQ